MFDLAGFIRMRLENAGVLMIDDIGVDTYSDERFLQLPPLGASQGAGLRPPCSCDHSGSLTRRWTQKRRVRSLDTDCRSNEPS